MADEAEEHDQSFQLVNGDDIVPNGISEAHSIQQILYWIGFTIPEQQTAIIEDAFGSFNDLRVLNDKDVRTMASDFAGQTQNNGHINLRTRRTKYIKAVIHWTQDFYRVSRAPSITGLTKSTFRTALNIALRRDEIRYNVRKQMKN